VTARITGLEAPKPMEAGVLMSDVTGVPVWEQAPETMELMPQKLHVVAAAGHFTPFLKSKIPASICKSFL